jgi:uncharacterized protein (TIGR03790 family)
MGKKMRGSSGKINNKSSGSFLGLLGVTLVIILLSLGTIWEIPPTKESEDERLSIDNLDAISFAPDIIKTSTRSELEYQDIVSYDDVLVVRNLNSPMSMQIADYFQNQRNIPQINICNITTITTETISRTGFEDDIRTPVEDHIVNNGLLGSINYIVTTKGVPLRVAEQDTSDDNWNQPWTIDRASMDAELALILGPYKNNIGDPWWINNPYFDPAPYDDFAFTKYGYFLVTRFTGYDWFDIKNLIDKPELAIGRHGTFILDVDPGRDGGGYQIGNDWLRSANATLTANNFSTYLDETNLFLTNQNNVSGYASWGSNDGNYPKNSLLNTGFENDANGDNIPDFWYFVNDTGVGFCERNDTEVRSGSWSLRITRNATNGNSTWAAQNYTVKPDTRYYAAGYANFSGVSPNMGARLQIRAYDSQGDVVAFYNGTLRTGTTGSWVSLGQVHFEPVQDIINISMGVVLSESSGTVYFDDIRLYEIKPHNDWIPGALAETFVSTGGRSFNYPTSYGQSLVADIIRDGVTGVKGYVYEPYLDAIAHPDILFDAYTQGFSSGESYYMASAYLGWMDTVVCDPKLSPYDPSIIPDLTIAPENITFSDVTPQEGQVIDIFANIENLGPASASNVEMEFYVGDPQTGLFLGSRILDIPGTGSNITSVLWDTTGYGGDHNITVVVDSQDYVFESNESNNIAYNTITVNTGFPTANAGLDDSIDEDSPLAFDGSGSWDNTSIENYTWDFKDGSFGFGENPSHTYTSSGIFVVILNVTNVFGLWDLDTVEITVNNVAPIANAGGDIMGLEGELISFDGSGSTDTVSDISTLNYTWNLGDGNVIYGLSPGHAYGDDGIFIVTLTVRDDDGASDMDTMTVSLGNVAPQIVPIPLQTLYEDLPAVIQVEASDVVGDPLTFSDNSSLFEIGESNGTINYDPKNEDVGQHLINITVIDDDGGVSHIEFTLRVENTNDPPIIVSQPIIQTQEDIQYEYLVEVVDDDLNISVGEAIMFSLDEAPQGMSITSYGRITWFPQEIHVSKTHTVIVNVTDSEEFDVQVYQIFVSNVNDKPQIVSSAITSVNEDADYIYDVDAQDEDADDQLTYSLDLAPEGMSIDPITGEIIWLPTNSDVGSVNIKVRVTDLNDSFDLQEFELFVYNTNDAPILEPIGDLKASEDQLFEYQVSASDEDPEDMLRFSVDSGPFNIDRNTGIIAFTPSNEDVGKHTVTITVIDNDGALDFETITFTVENVNDPPSLDFIAISYLTEDESFSYTVTASDMDADDTLTFSDDTDLFDIDPVTGEISFTPTNDHVGEHSITISVLDGDGESDFQIVRITIENVNDPPAIDALNLPGSGGEVDLKAGSPFEFIVEVIDEDTDDDFTFSDDTNLFNIDPESGKIYFIPNSNDAGVHKVRITVTDTEGESDYVFLTFDIKGEEEEGVNLLWIVLIVIIIVIFIVILLLIMLRKKEKPQDVPMEDEGQSNFQEIPNPQIYPPPPPPPPPPRN